MVCLGTGEEQQGVGIVPAVNLPSVRSMDSGMLPFHAGMSSVRGAQRHKPMHCME